MFCIVNNTWVKQTKVHYTSILSGISQLNLFNNKRQNEIVSIGVHILFLADEERWRALVLST